MASFTSLFHARRRPHPKRRAVASHDAEGQAGLRLHLGAVLMLLHRSVDGLQATSCCDQSLGAFDSNVWHCELRAHAGRPLARSKPAPPASTALRWKTPCLLRLVLQQNEPLTRVLDELVADVLSGGLRDCRSYVGEADRQSSAGGFCTQGASRKSMCDCRTSKRAGLRLTLLGVGVDHGAAPSSRRSAIAEVANVSSRKPR